MKKFQLNTATLANKKRNLSRIAKQTREDDLLILDDFKNLIRPHKPDEFSQLKENIRANGVRDALVVWDDSERKVLIDGHHRWKALNELRQEGHDIDYRVEIMAFPTAEEAKDWMIDNQLGRRNLTDPERKYLIGLYYRREKQRHGGDRKSSGQTDHSVQTDSKSATQKTSGQTDHLKTADEIARREGMGEKTVRRAAEYSKGIDILAQKRPEIRDRILSGEIKLRQADIQDIGKGKIAPEQILTQIDKQEKNETPETSQNTPENTVQQLRMPVKEDFFAQDLSPKEIDKLNRAHDKIESAVRQLQKTGLTKTQIRWILTHSIPKK
ncbi:hypothetical protein FUAX_55290 (plasmid) [Fulvitalea axinellae]|uniref:ParB-like N-terminal domain-containing protein n=1 Tax=Fulvitalea axinellae TaxID=1182444 RepID=A0AAU9D1T9_9BACT|nr:hypothetical protein FUAX_55290 [Fulvitalea axinellae]